MTNYKCNNCGAEFHGGDYTLECPSCKSNDIIEQSVAGGRRFLEILKNNRTLTAIIGVIITVIVLFSLKNCESDVVDSALKDLRIKTNNKDNHIEISIYDVSDKKNKHKVAYYDNPKLYRLLGFKAYQDGNQIKIIEDKIYPCTSDFIKLTWNSTVGLPNTSKMINNFSLKSKVNKNARCREKLTLSVRPSDCDCKLEVSSNYDELDPSETIMISINGRDGKYLEKREWTLNKNKNKYDVWGYIKGRDTIRAIPGKGKIKACVKFNALDYERIAKNYAQNPSDLYALAEFRSRTQRTFVTMYKGQIISLNALSNKLRTEWKNNGTTFNVHIEWNSNGSCGDLNKTVKSINFN